MPKIKPKFYWDACIFLAWLRDEKRSPGEMEGLAEVAALIAQSNAILVTSVVTRVEVLESTLPEKTKMLLETFFKRRNIIRVNVDDYASNLAHEIRDFYKKQNMSIKSADAMHLAAAITYGVDQFHTFDDELLRLNGRVAEYPLEICKPSGIQRVLFL
jgi:predicted nucleic acid-binding protein